ncbi:MAG TPA: DNA polymerase III subunit beta [Bacteroidales bacterium]|nr:DNA polymerase III subunit beta [Bacteroidales bacterium]
MIINIARDDLYAGLSSLQNITNKKGTIAILVNILLETDFDSIILTATDLEVGIKIKIPAEILTPGSITLPSKKLFEIIRETTDQNIKIELSENNWVKIITNSGNYKLAGTDSEEYPNFPEFNEEILVTVPSDALKEIIEKTVFAISTESETQFNLTGALFEKEVKDNKNYIRFVSSDGHRLSLMEREVDTDISKLNCEKTILIPRKGILEIKKICEKKEFIEIGFDAKQAVLKTENTLMIIRLLNGDFPNYKNIVNAINKDKFIEINKSDFIAALKRVNLFSNDEYSSVKFSLKENLLTLTSQDLEIGSGNEDLKISYSGEDLIIGFNVKYFIESLQVMNSDKIKGYLNSENTPFLIEGDDDPGYLSIIMPMKI